jgi:type VI secretion system protein ImpA
MTIDVEELLAPIDGDSPAGPDLSYDPARYQLEQAFEQSVSVNSSGEAEAAAEIDWSGIIDTVVGQFGRTKDVWLAVYLCRAGARAGRLDAIEAGAQALEGLFSRYWDEVHPTLDELGVPGRKTPCDSLARRSEFLGPLERMPLIRHPRLGVFSGIDIERFRANGSSEEGYGFFRAALDEQGEGALQEVLGRLDAIDKALKGADRAFMEGAGSEDSPNFAATYEALATLKRAVGSFVGGQSAAEADEGPGAPVQAVGSSTAPQAAAGAGGASGGERLSGRIDSREEVVRAIEMICDYYRRREPASPVPMVLQRAQGWVTADFMEIMRDIAPDGFDEAKKVLVRRPVEDEDE